MGERKNLRYAACYGLLAALLVLLLALSAGMGSTRLAPGQVLDVLLSPGAGGTAGNIVWNIRLPRLLAAALLGGALSVSGFQLQTFFANPIAGPFVLGISSSAKLTVALTLIWCVSRQLPVSSAALVLAAFCGSLLAMGLLLLVSGRLGNMALLIVCGVMIGYVCNAVTDIAVTFSDDANIVNLHNWSMGSFSGTDWDAVRVMAVTVLAALAGSFLLSKPMGAYQLGEAYARSMGVNVRLFRVLLILLSGVLSACVTAFAGPISFVGIAVPHLVKSLFRTARPIVMVPACFLGGGVFCLFCDLIARTLFAPTELSISSVTAAFGAPVVLWVLLSRRRAKSP